ncbi:hypothetical protein LSH36_31g01007 [Paralvinella palmiformis]|uniref:Large ribosomal subunit protein mL53 n=1 Tax=Paralvinella palmiformis TaxID=53620 RepID=A0AAD9NG99_9ANNE|nr:hypothetical protein LSH36_31g01007 [Paralvinella palmiformis]
MGGLARALGLQLKRVDLMACTQITYSFDPFAANVKSVRQFLFALSPTKTRSTNYNCSYKIDVKSDRSSPKIHVKFVDGHEAIFKTENLSTYDIVRNFNQLCEQHSRKK